MKKEDIEELVRHSVEYEQIWHYKNSLMVKDDDLEAWKRSNPVPGVVYPAAHLWQKRFTYPFEHDYFDKFKSAIYYLYFAGNRGGKSIWLMCWVAMECLGIHPLQDAGVRPKPPVHWWVVSPNLPSESEVPRGEDAPIIKTLYEWLPSIQDCPAGIVKFYRKDKILTVRDEKGEESVVNFKSHDQEKSKFKSEKLDGIAWDEEPPRGLWEEGVSRILDKKGIFLLAMTPDYGSWTFSLLKNKSNPDYMIQEMDALENPYMPKEQRERILSTMSEDQLMMRRKGMHIQFKGKVFPFNYEKHVGKPFTPSHDTTNYVIIDWHPAKPIVVSYLAIDARGIWYVFNESVVESHVVEHVVKDIQSKLTLPDCKLEVKKYIIDAIAQIEQVQDGKYKPKSIVDMMRGFGIIADSGKPVFEAGQAFLTRKLNYRELFFDPKCKLHIEQWDTWGAKRYLHGNMEGTLRDQLEVEGNDTCINLVYAYNAGAKWNSKYVEEEPDFRPRSNTSLLYKGAHGTQTWADRQREKDRKEGYV